MMYDTNEQNVEKKEKMSDTCRKIDIHVYIIYTMLVQGYNVKYIIN